MKFWNSFQFSKLLTAKKNTQLLWIRFNCTNGWLKDVSHQLQNKCMCVASFIYILCVFFLFWFWLFNLILCSMNCPGIQLQRSKHKTTWLVCKTEFQPICFCTSSNTYIRTSPNMNKLYCVIHLSFILLITAVNRAHTTAHAWNIVKQRRRMLFDDVRKKCFTIKISYFRSQNAAHLLSGFSISFSLCVCVYVCFCCLLTTRATVFVYCQLWHI